MHFCGGRIHMIIPGGRLPLDGRSWILCYLLSWIMPFGLQSEGPVWHEMNQEGSWTSSRMAQVHAPFHQFSK